MNEYFIANFDKKEQKQGRRRLPEKLNFYSSFWQIFSFSNWSQVPRPVIRIDFQKAEQILRKEMKFDSFVKFQNVGY
jgi:hypothetical protein